MPKMNLRFFHNLTMIMVHGGGDVKTMKMTFHIETLKYSLAQFESIYCNKLLVCCQTHLDHKTIMMKMKVAIMLMMAAMMMMTVKEMSSNMSP